MQSPMLTSPGKWRETNIPSMALRYSFDLPEDAQLIEDAVKNVLAKGLRTGDIMAPGMAAVSTTTMTDAMLQELDKMAD